MERGGKNNTEKAEETLRTVPKGASKEQDTTNMAAAHKEHVLKPVCAQEIKSVYASCWNTQGKVRRGNSASSLRYQCC